MFGAVNALFSGLAFAGVVYAIFLQRMDLALQRKELAKAGVVAENPDVFLCRLFADSPESAVTAFKRMRDNLRHPPKTTRECADTLAAQGLKKFAGLITAMLE